MRSEIKQWKLSQKKRKNKTQKKKNVRITKSYHPDSMIPINLYLNTFLRICLVIRKQTRLSYLP